MKKKDKIIKVSIIIITFLVVLVGFIGIMFFVGNTLTPPDANRIERYFSRNREDLVLIANYFSESDRSSIHFWRSDFYGTNRRNLRISDEEVIEALERLFNERNFDVIARKGNTIHFQVFSRMDLGVGIAYSINKEDKPILESLTKLEPLSENGWYFYEEDVNEWRRRNR